MRVRRKKSLKQHFYESEDFMKVLENLDPETFIDVPNPVLAIECFLEARKNKIAIPEACLRWLTLNLQAWHDAQGEKPLDELLGLSLGHGKRASFQNDIRHERDKKIFIEIEMLKLLGVGLEDAAEMVRRKLASRGNHEGGLLIGQAAIVRNYKASPVRADLKETIMSYRHTLSPEGWLAFFDSFSPDSFSSRVRKLHAKAKKLVSRSKDTPPR
jgi:hypothetical protein